MLPPTLVVTAEGDPLRDEGEALARRLAEEGVAVIATRYLGQIHGFWRHHAVFPAAEAVLQQTARFLAQHKLPLSKLITHRFKLDEAERAYQLFDQQTMGKGMILPA